MSKIFVFVFGMLSFNFMYAQHFSGQWKGEFIDKSSSYGSFSGDKCDYVLELDVSGSKVSGASYTYFTENGKKYYTICKVEGSIDFKKKFIEVKETERTKTNIPTHIRNCLQVHKLTYFKQGDVETLEGNWVPIPNQEGSCGFGNTNLTRRSLVNSYPKAITINQTSTNKSAGESTVRFNNNDVKSKLRNPAAQKRESTSGAISSKTEHAESKNKSDLTSSEIAPAEIKRNAITDSDSKLVKRKNTVLKTIEVENSTIKIDLYDNGEVDGDSISLFYNGKLLLPNKGLTTKPISLTLKIDDEDSVNELAMYAENLGAIAPNTALMIVTDGPNRYEVRITSDLEKSGVIRFVHKSPK